MSEQTRLNTHKLAAARLWAAARHPYLASALFASNAVAVPGLGGASVDEAWRLYVDPAVVDAWSVEMLGSLLVHHTGHLVRDHADRARAQGVGPDTAADWALAVDAEINDDLIGTGLRLPEDSVMPHAMGWEQGRLAEEYFHRDSHRRHPSPDCGSGADSITREWEASGELGGGLPPGERHLLQCQVASEVLRHAREGLGRVPNSWRRWAEGLLEPAVDWRTVLAAEMRKGISTVAGRVDYTYRRPSRRAGVSPGVVLPALEQPVPEVAVVCDTSGSMSDEKLARVLTEVEGLLRGIGLARTRVRVLAADAAVHTARRVSSARQVELVGGGGTDMGVGIDAAARLRPKPSVVVVLTDGLTPWPPEGPKGVRVIVGLIGDSGPGRSRQVWAPPRWARVVPIDAAA
ncbi:MAG: vWA domain-containing protein [Acidimicrobiales bacterium]